jgi:hypothetical protein
MHVVEVDLVVKPFRHVLVLVHDMLDHGCTLFSDCIAPAIVQETRLHPILCMPIQSQHVMPYSDGA